MKTLKSTIIDILKEQECVNISPSPFMNHIVIKVEEDANFAVSYEKIKNSVLSCIDKHLPHRTENVMVEVTNEKVEANFSVPQTTPAGEVIR